MVTEKTVLAARVFGLVLGMVVMVALAVPLVTLAAQIVA
jgi:tetrahydromethanopterin S-methyltransferase subunit F